MPITPAPTKKPSFIAHVYQVGNRPRRMLVRDVMRTATDLVSPFPEDWCLDPDPRKRVIVCHCPHHSDLPVNSQATFRAGQVIRGTAIIFDYNEMADSGFAPPEGE